MLSLFLVIVVTMMVMIMIKVLEKISNHLTLAVEKHLYCPRFIQEVTKFSGVSSEVLEHPPQLLASFFSRLASIVIYPKADHLASSLILHSKKVGSEFNNHIGEAHAPGTFLP